MSMKRQPSLPRPARSLHGAWSKSVVHEALLDLWMEHTGRDRPPDALTADEWREYETDVLRRSEARRRQG